MEMTEMEKRIFRERKREMERYPGEVKSQRK